MKTCSHFFTPQPMHPIYADRQSKIEQLRKPVYSKKLKQKKHRRGLASSQFFDAPQIRIGIKTMYKSSLNEPQKVKRSKSDFSLARKRYQQSQEDAKMEKLVQNLVIEKVEYQKSTPQIVTKKNNFLKLFDNAILSGNITPYKQKSSSVKTPGQGTTKNLKNYVNLYEESPIFKRQNGLVEQNQQRQQFDHRRQKIKLVQMFKNNQTPEQTIINELSELRKKRNSIGQQNKSLESTKKQSLIRKNSLFLMNYLKQKEKQLEGNKSPHINHMRNTASNIKIKENAQLKKALINKLSEKNVSRSKFQADKEFKINKIFNTMKIQPW